MTVTLGMEPESRLRLDLHPSRYRFQEVVSTLAGSWPLHGSVIRLFTDETGCVRPDMPTGSFFVVSDEGVVLGTPARRAGRLTLSPTVGSHAVWKPLVTDAPMARPLLGASRVDGRV